MDKNKNRADEKTEKYKLQEADKMLICGLPFPFLRWFSKEARLLPWRADREPYHVWLSEMMLQQTRAEAVKGYYSRFLEACPDIHALALAPEEKVYKLWEGLGYYRRAANLHKAARMIVQERNGVFPCTYDEILALPGVGEYTAGAVASICFSLPKPAVDGNVLRVLARILDCKVSIDQPLFKRQIARALEEAMLAAMGLPGFDAGDFNQSLMEAGAVLCLPKGALHCAQCPAQPVCRGRKAGRAQLLPVRDDRKTRQVENKTVLILTRGGGDALTQADKQVAFRRRAGTGLLASMWELPNVDGWLNPGEAIALAAAWGAEPVSLEQVLEREHVFTHRLWKMKAYVIHCQAQLTAPAGDRAYAQTEKERKGSLMEGAIGADLQDSVTRQSGEEALVWTDAAQRDTAFPLPSAFRQFLAK